MSIAACMLSFQEQLSLLLNDTNGNAFVYGSGEEEEEEEEDQGSDGNNTTTEDDDDEHQILFDAVGKKRKLQDQDDDVCPEAIRRVLGVGVRFAATHDVIAYHSRLEMAKMSRCVTWAQDDELIDYINREMLFENIIKQGTTLPSSFIYLFLSFVSFFISSSLPLPSPTS